MASDAETVHNVLGLLDRHFFKTLEHAVEQFKEHKQRFHESLLANIQLRNLKPPPAWGPDYTHFLCAADLPKKDTASSTDNIENADSGAQHGKNQTGRPYALRSRAAKKPSEPAAPQRVTRSRAKQVEAKTTDTDIKLKCQDRERTGQMPTSGRACRIIEERNPSIVIVDNRTEILAVDSSCGTPEVHGSAMKSPVQDVASSQTPYAKGRMSSLGPDLAGKPGMKEMARQTPNSAEKESLFISPDRVHQELSTEQNLKPSLQLVVVKTCSNNSNKSSRSRSHGKDELKSSQGSSELGNAAKLHSKQSPVLSSVVHDVLQMFPNVDKSSGSDGPPEQQDNQEFNKSVVEHRVSFPSRGSLSRVCSEQEGQEKNDNQLSQEWCERKPSFCTGTASSSRRSGRVRKNSSYILGSPAVLEAFKFETDDESINPLKATSTCVQTALDITSVENEKLDEAREGGSGASLEALEVSVAHAALDLLGGSPVQNGCRWEGDGANGPETGSQSSYLGSVQKANPSPCRNQDVSPSAKVMTSSVQTGVAMSPSNRDGANGPETGSQSFYLGSVQKANPSPCRNRDVSPSAKVMTSSVQAGVAMSPSNHDVSSCLCEDLLNIKVQIDCERSFNPEHGNKEESSLLNVMQMANTFEYTSRIDSACISEDIRNSNSGMDCSLSPSPAHEVSQGDEVHELGMEQGSTPKDCHSLDVCIHNDAPASTFEHTPRVDPACISEDIRNSSSGMDCNVSPSPAHGMVQGDHNHELRELAMEQSSTPKDCDTLDVGIPKDELDVRRFSHLLAQGTVNRSRRKRARSPVESLTELCAPSKKMRLSLEVNVDQGPENIDSPTTLARTDLSRTSFAESESPSLGLVRIPYSLSGLKGLRSTTSDTSMNSLLSTSTPCYKGFYAKTSEFHGFSSLLKGNLDMEEPRNSFSGTSLPKTGSNHMDTPFFRANFAARSNPARKRGKPVSQLDINTEETGKENKNPNSWSVDATLVKQDAIKVRKVLGYANQDTGMPDSSHKRYNLAVSTSSFLDLIQKKQAPLPYPNGKREVRVKALEAAEAARRQEEKREQERKMRKLECNEARSTESECLLKDKVLSNHTVSGAAKGVTSKVKRVAQLKQKMDQEKARKKEEEQKKKEEEWKKKEAEFALRKRKREDAEKKEREEKRKRVEEVQRLRKEQEERQRLELDEKEQKRKALEERERERKAQEEEAKRQRRLEKEREAERRRKKEQEAKATWLAEKQLEKKRKEAFVLTRGHEDEQMGPYAASKKLSALSTDSLSMTTSADWEAQFRNNGVKSHMRDQTNERGTSVPNILPFVAALGTSVHYPENLGKSSSSTSFGEISFKFSSGPMNEEEIQKIDRLNDLCPHNSTPSNTKDAPNSIRHLDNIENGTQSYEISPYKSSDDEEDEDDDKPTKPIPLWARKENLLPLLIQQQCIDPDDIFLSDKTCSLAEIFGTTGSRKCKDFNQRSMSGDWLDDHATWKEELDYKRTMGYARH